MQRVQWQEALQPLHGVHRKEAQRVEEQHRPRVRFPAHLFLGCDAEQAIGQPLQWADQPIEKHRLALVHPRHVGAQRLGEQQQDDDVEPHLEPAIGGHENSSGLSSATKR